MWNTTPEIPTYRYKIMKIESRYLQETGTGGVSDHNFHSPDISSVSRYGRGIYFATVRAIDKYGNIVKRQTLYFYYDGNKFNNIGSENEPIHY